MREGKRLTIGHLDFVGGVNVNKECKSSIFIFSNKQNGKKLKKPALAGRIFINEINGKAVFHTYGQNTFLAESLAVILSIMQRLDNGSLKFNQEEGKMVSL